MYSMKFKSVVMLSLLKHFSRKTKQQEFEEKKVLMVTGMFADVGGSGCGFGVQCAQLNSLHSQICVRYNFAFYGHAQ